MFKKWLALTTVSAVAFGTFAIPALARHEAQKTPADPAVVQAELTCMKTAVEKREASILAALETYYNSVKTALATRSTALNAAWAITDKKERRAAIKVAWQGFKGTWQKSNKTLNKGRRHDAWVQFDTDKKACGSVKDEEPRSEN